MTTATLTTATETTNQLDLKAIASGSSTKYGKIEILGEAEFETPWLCIRHSKGGMKALDNPDFTEAIAKILLETGLTTAGTLRLFPSHSDYQQAKEKSYDLAWLDGADVTANILLTGGCRDALGEAIAHGIALYQQAEAAKAIAIPKTAKTEKSTTKPQQPKQGKVTARLTPDPDKPSKVTQVTDESHAPTLRELVNRALLEKRRQAATLPPKQTLEDAIATEFGDDDEPTPTSQPPAPLPTSDTIKFPWNHALAGGELILRDTEIILPQPPALILPEPPTQEPPALILPLPRPAAKVQPPAQVKKTKAKKPRKTAK